MRAPLGKNSLKFDTTLFEYEFGCNVDTFDWRWLNYLVLHKTLYLKFMHHIFII